MRRIVLSAVVTLAAYYAVFGGEYDLLDVRAVNAERQAAVERLKEAQSVTDSLAARADSLEHDDRVLERLARERFGLVGEGEILYRFAEPSDGAEEGG